MILRAKRGELSLVFHMLPHSTPKLDRSNASMAGDNVLDLNMNDNFLI